MDPFTPDEIEGIVHAMAQKQPTEEERAKVPLRPPGNYGKVAKVCFSPIPGELPRPLSEITDKERGNFAHLLAQVEVVFGQTTLSLKELAALEVGSLLPLNELCDEPVSIMVNGVQIAKGEVIAVDGHFAVKIICFTKN